MNEGNAHLPFVSDILPAVLLATLRLVFNIIKIRFHVLLLGDGIPWIGEVCINTGGVFDYFYAHATIIFVGDKCSLMFFDVAELAFVAV